MEGKAMVVTMSRDIAARLYEQIRLLRPDWHDADDERGAMKVVVTGTPTTRSRCAAMSAPRRRASAWPSASRPRR
jgi:type I site-specific restriction-modification system R (restriction) subunit